MKLTIEHILNLIEELPLNTNFNYVSGGDSKAKLIYVDKENSKVEIARVNADGSEKNASMTTDILNSLVANIKENIPFKFDNVLNGSGNVRSTMEAIFAHTKEFYSCKIKRVKHLIWVPSIPHKVGKIVDYDTIKQSIEAILNSEKSKIGKKDLPFIIALRTKPFLLLAGISGTGKSQKVQELAFMTCLDGELRNEGGTTPGNYCMVEVKPNWHDSTELLGYYSALSGKYELTDFIRFVYKATQYKDVPFFLCLDEMNLAPVEQYFAEFLSVLETRKKVGDEILTQYLLSKDRFSNCELQKKVLVKEDGDIIEGDKQYKMEFMYSEKDTEIIKYLKENGLTLPDNLFVIGTVNMDDTTHQFSRKVIDRAFTIEMNGGKMSEMFTPESKFLLEYREEPIPLEVFKSQFVRAYEVLDDARFEKYRDVISTRIPEILGDSDGTAMEDSINGVLNDTPFRVSYRVQNELVIYLSILIERANFPEPENIEGLISEATLAILLEKVLPRVQGEQKQLETKKGTSNVLKDLKAFVESHFKSEETDDVNNLYNRVVKKLDEMDKKLDNYYTNFF